MTGVLTRHLFSGRPLCVSIAVLCCDIIMLGLWMVEHRVIGLLCYHGSDMHYLELLKHIKSTAPYAAPLDVCCVQAAITL